MPSHAATIRSSTTLLRWLALACLLAVRGTLSAGTAPITNAVVLAIANQVEVRRYGSEVWDPAYIQPTNQMLNPGDRLRTGRNSRALVRLSSLTDFPVGQLTQLEIPRLGSERVVVRLLKGVIYFFHRDRPGEFQVDTPTVSAVVRGTEFAVVVDEDGSSQFQVLDGALELSNAFGSLSLHRGQEAIASPGQAPTRTATIVAGLPGTVQWCLYYPAVLNLDELDLSPEEVEALGPSLAAYRTGDLLSALDRYPHGREASSEQEKLYRAALLLAAGSVRESDALLKEVATSPVASTANLQLLAKAMQVLIDVVQAPSRLSRNALATSVTLATAWLAECYRCQRHSDLVAARRAARRATELAPAFPFAWAKLAELEFGFGRTEAAEAAVKQSLHLAPRHAESLALRGFLLAARNRSAQAQAAFEQAILLDGALGSAWLGRGLCLIHEGRIAEGRADLQTAAALEPNRSFLRSYLGKAWTQSGQYALAQKELALAKELDPSDPTPWLYSALLERDRNRINTAIGDLEKSVALNEDRRVYRSEFLLDQDRAVRSTGLATLYDKAGMAEVSVREAARAVAGDYGSYSAHLFLANSLDALRDPTGFNLRYETAWFHELLVANLLAPAAAGTFSQNISQQEYSRLFEANRFGLTSDASWRSDGQTRAFASQFGILGNFSYALDGEYQHNDGVRPNNELDRAGGTLTLKQQLTPRDSFLLQVAGQDYHSGDNFQYYDPDAGVRTNYSFDEHQAPSLAAGFHREWAPGVHTLILGARVAAEQEFSDRGTDLYLLVPLSPFAPVNQLGAFPFDVDYRNDLEIYSLELNQVYQTASQTLVAGARFQAGDFRASDLVIASDPNSRPLFAPPPTHEVREGFGRFAGYAYYTHEIVEHLFVTGGFAYDQVTYPRDYRDVPLSPGQATRSQISPKAGLVWSPSSVATVRAAYAQSLGGVSLDQSYRLEPVQLAGFPQTFRTIIPESIVSSVSAPAFETFGAALDLKFTTGTFFGIEGRLLRSDVDRDIGLFVFENGVAGFPPATTRQRLNYDEPSLTVTLDQLAGRCWSFGLHYRFTHSRLNQEFPEISAPAVLPPNLRVQADLHELTPYVRFNHSSGFFARLDIPWYNQSNSGYSPGLLGDSFVQLNLFAGYRFPRQAGDLVLGLLNVAGTDYRLNPLSPYAEQPRERVWSVRLRLNF
jgi:Flp pilus assembly protein TadD